MRPSSLAVAAAAALTLLATACGPQSSDSAESSPASPSSAPATSATKPADPLAAWPADKIAQTSLANLKAAPAVHVSGSLSDSGTTIGLDLTQGATKCAGTISESGTGSFQILQDGTTVWLKPDDEFWKSAAGSDQSVLSELEGKYLKTTTTDKDFSSLADLCSPVKFGALLDQPTSGLVKGKATVVSGVPELQLRDSGDADFFAVSDTAAPRLLELGQDAKHKLDFSGYGTAATVTPPSASETLSGSQYGL
jgi:hypothetical protein